MSRFWLYFDIWVISKPKCWQVYQKVFIEFNCKSAIFEAVHYNRSHWPDATSRQSSFESRQSGLHCLPQRCVTDICKAMTWNPIHLQNIIACIQIPKGIPFWCLSASTCFCTCLDSCTVESFSGCPLLKEAKHLRSFCVVHPSGNLCYPGYFGEVFVLCVFKICIHISLIALFALA